MAYVFKFILFLWDEKILRSRARSEPSSLPGYPEHHELSRYQVRILAGYDGVQILKVMVNSDVPTGH